MPEYKESAHLLLRSDLPWIRQFTFTSFPEKCSCQFLGSMRHLHSSAVSRAFPPAYFASQAPIEVVKSMNTPSAREANLHERTKKQ